MEQFKLWWNPSTQSNLKQIESVVLTEDPKMFLGAFLLASTPKHFPLDTITVSLRSWTAIPQMLKGLLYSPDIFTNWNRCTYTPRLTNKALDRSRYTYDRNLFTFSNLRSFANLQTTYGLFPRSFYVYLSIRSLLSKIHWIKQDKVLPPLLKFYESNNNQLKGITHIYGLFSQASGESIQKQISKWSTFILSTPSTDQWFKALSLPSQLSHGTTHWESLKKLFQQ